jgi:putative redox protein
LLAGFGTGGALAIVAGAADPTIEAVAALGTSADFDDWAGNPRRLLQHARDINLITDPSYPPSLEEWTRDLRRIRPITSARALAPRPFLVLHGSEDESVPVFDARVLSDAHGSAELRIIDGAGHQLRHDPRAIAVLLGWLDRQKHRVPTGE